MLSLGEPPLPCQMPSHLGTKKLGSPERLRWSHQSALTLPDLTGGCWFCLEGDSLQEPAAQWHPRGVLQNGCGNRVLPAW